MSSTKSGGASIITLEFNLDLSLDVAEQEVQAAINASSSLLADGPSRRRPYTVSGILPIDDNDAWRDIENFAASAGAEPVNTRAARAEDLASNGCRARVTQRRAATGRARPGESKALASNGLNLEDVRTGIAASERQSGEGQLRRTAARSRRSTLTISSARQLSTQSHYRVSQRRSHLIFRMSRLPLLTALKISGSPRDESRYRRSSSMSSVSPART